MSNYRKLTLMNLDKLYLDLPTDLGDRLGAECEGTDFTFPAFGRTCRLHPDGLSLDGEEEDGPMGIILSLYALHAEPGRPADGSVTAFREFRDSAPYVGAFKTHTENILIPFVESIETARQEIMETLNGVPDPPDLGVSCDFSFTVTPLPKIRLTYLFYLPDEGFPASATCLYSENAGDFLPIDALADVGEYTSRRILEIIGALRGR